jgi:hypothetical protein
LKLQNDGGDCAEASSADDADDADFVLEMLHPQIKADHEVFFFKDCSSPDQNRESA